MTEARWKNNDLQIIYSVSVSYMDFLISITLTRDPTLVFILQIP